MIHQSMIFTAEECNDLKRSIHILRPDWNERELVLEHGGKVFHEKSYSLGINSYVEGREDTRRYREKAQKSNQLLRAHFGWLYDRLLKKVSSVVGTNTVYDERFALPGFHIFLASKTFELPVAPIHFDVHHLLLDWSGLDVSFDDTLSFTASISLPQGGAGLNLWDLTSQEIEGKNWNEILELVGQRPMTFLPYTTGGIVIHSGKIIHQIASWKEAREGEERITLQGQGIRCKDSYLLYW